MKNKYRLSAAVVAAVMAFSLPVTAEEYKEGEISRFDSFGDYVSERGKGLPAGWMLTKGQFVSPGVGSVVDEERSGNVMKAEGDNAPAVLFGSIFTDGKMHISFDVKQVGDENFPDTMYAKSLRLDINGDPYLDDANSKKDTTIDDPTVFSKENGYGHNLFETKNAATEPEEKQFMTAFEWAHRWKGTRRVSQKMFEPEIWHKLEFYIDKDSANQNVYIYMDGEEVAFYDGSTLRTMSFANSDITAKLKGMVLTIAKRTSESGDMGGFLFDNVYIKSYYADEVYKDAPAITTDDGTGEGIERQNALLNVGFSEYMDRPVEKSDIKITNFITGAEVKNFEIKNSDNMQFDVLFGESTIAAGKYLIEANNVKGAISGLEVGKAAEFSTVAEEIDGVKVPWLENIEFETYDGKRLAQGKAVSSGVNRIRVKFSAPVDNTDTASKIKLFLNGEEVPWESITAEEENRTLCLKLSQFLKANSTYNLSVDKRINAYGSETVQLLAPYSTEFMTENDGMFEVIGQSYTVSGKGAGKKGNLSIDVLKTRDTAEKYTLYLAAYNDVYDSVLGRNVKKLVKLGGGTVVFDADERCIKTGKASVTVADIGDAKMQWYLLSYPGQKCVAKGVVGE